MSFSLQQRKKQKKQVSYILITSKEYITEYYCDFLKTYFLTQKILDIF